MTKIVKAYKGEKAISPNHMPPKLNWSVMWLRKGTVVEVWCEDDFSEAMRLYDLAKRAGKKMATLRCANYAFPPPRDYTEREVIVRRKVGNKVKKVKTTRNVMGQANAKGWWWCPYCITFRKFRHQLGFRLRDTGIYVPQEGMYCPMCGISHKNGFVQRWNPHAARFEHRFRKRGRKKGKSGRRN